MKAKQDNDMTNRTGMIFVGYNTKLLRPIGKCAVNDEDENGQRCDQSYKSTLR